jgi:HEAT repeat protein
VPLVEALQDTDESVRESAAKALGMLGEASAVEPLTCALEDEAGPVRSAVASALGDIGDTAAIAPLLAQMERESHGLKPSGLAVAVSWEDARPSIAWALGQLRDPIAAPCLCDCLKDSSPYLRFSAAQALGEISDPRSLVVLRAMLTDDPQLSAMAAFALLLAWQEHGPSAIGAGQMPVLGAWE